MSGNPHCDYVQSCLYINPEVQNASDNLKPCMKRSIVCPVDFKTIQLRSGCVRNRNKLKNIKKNWKTKAF